MTSFPTSVDSVEQWARTNNLTVNPSRYSEIVFRDNHQKINVQPPAAIPGIKQVTDVRLVCVVGPVPTLPGDKSGYFRFMNSISVFGNLVSRVIEDLGGHPRA